jgi:hypothetical protein
MKDKKEKTTTEATCNCCHKQMLVAFSGLNTDWNFCGNCAGDVNSLKKVYIDGEFKEFDSLDTKQALDFLRTRVADMMNTNCSLVEKLIDAGIIVDEFLKKK